MAAFVDNDDDNFWQLATLYVDSFTPRCPPVFRDRVNPLTDLDKVELRARFRVTKQCFANLLATL